MERHVVHSKDVRVGLGYALLFAMTPKRKVVPTKMGGVRYKQVREWFKAHAESFSSTYLQKEC
jgi:hypothetical protein